MSALGLPAASLRLAMAVRYWHSARLLMSQRAHAVEFFEPVGHLLGMCAELALKAHLLERGMTERELGGHKIGHDLAEVLRHAIQRGLEIEEDDAHMVLVMREAHLKHFHRYGPRISDDKAYLIALPNEEMALTALARIIDLTARDYSTLRRMHQRPTDLDWPHTAAPTRPATLAGLKVLAKEVEAYAKMVESAGAPHSSR